MKILSNINLKLFGCDRKVLEPLNHAKDQIVLECLNHCFQQINSLKESAITQNGTKKTCYISLRHRCRLSHLLFRFKPHNSLRAPLTARFLFPRPSTNLKAPRRCKRYSYDFSRSKRRLNRPVGALWLYGLAWC